MEKIAFIGLGMMGWPMAKRLHQAGYPLLLADARQDVVDRFVQEHPGAGAVTNPEAYKDCTVFITMLPNSDIVDAVVAQILPFISPGSCLIEMSSADPTQTRALAERLAEKQVSLIDAPVSGGVKKAMDGQLSIMVGGEPEPLKKAQAILKTMGKSVMHVGGVGAGHALKALNNYVSAAALIATAEAVKVGAAFGIEPSVVVDVLNVSTGKNNTTENKAHQFMLNEAFNSGFSLALQAKDVAIAESLARNMGFSMSMAQCTRQITTEASQALGPTADHTELFRYLGA